MIFNDFLRALRQLGDPRFRRVLWLGLGLTVALLFGVYAVFLGLINWLVPDEATIPGVGTVTWIDDLLSGASILFMLVLSIFLMVPVASAFTSLFLDDVAEAVEHQHYGHLPPGKSVGFFEGLRDSVNFMGVLIAANLVAFVIYAVFAPAAPLLFIGLNGYLLGREYFQLVAMRRMPRDHARALRRKHSVIIWMAGALMAVPLMVPLANLFVPVLGAATFTHLFHRLADSSYRTNPDLSL
ncbi:EI24 domain-containing protein [Oceaniglobus ichthyenteri]|uniref:EI24 domain-containing protein n=1 Tax=Oceaniglobus ichthyenteri TaxID=2136177 RepID=UPI000D3543C1|nr:EI24 domain-containing protein [Oceaniglobus ichthyenteri]